MKRMEEQSKGTLKFEYFPSAQLGQPNEIFEGLKVGSVDLTVQGTGLTGGVVPAFNVIFLPYRWNGPEHIEKFVQSKEFKTYMADPLEKQGIKVINTWARTPRHLATRNTLVKTPADLRGVKLRVPETIASFNTWKAVGANPQPIAWGEVYSGLQTGVVDACEAPMESLNSISAQEVCKYVMLTGHVLDEEVVLLSDTAYKKLSPEQQKIVYDTCAEARTWAAERAKADEQRLIEKFKASGVQIIEPDVASFVKACSGVVKELTEQIAPGLDAIILSMK
jgi:tripartite ATP-independent transporter DctP family solute receptor